MWPPCQSQKGMLCRATKSIYFSFTPSLIDALTWRYFVCPNGSECGWISDNTRNACSIDNDDVPPLPWILSFFQRPRCCRPFYDESYSQCLIKSMSHNVKISSSVADCFEWGRDKSWNELLSFSWRARVSFPGNVEVNWERGQVAEPLELSQKKSNMLKGSLGGPVSVGKHTSKFDVSPCQPALAVSHSFSRCSNTAVLSCRVANNS